MEFLLLIPALLLFYYLFRPVDKRPKELIAEYGVRFTPNTVYSAEDMRKVITAFIDVWTEFYPGHRKPLLRQLKKTNINWVGKRISTPKGNVLAKMDKVGEIQLWVGPRLINGQRDIVYTGFIDQLAKLTLLANNINPDTNNPVIKGIIRRVVERLVDNS